MNQTRRAPTVVSLAAPPNKDGVILTRGGEKLSFDSAGRLINSSGQRCDIYGRITKARGAKGRNSSNRRGWDGWQGSEGSHWRDACTELKKLTSLSTNTHS